MTGRVVHFEIPFDDGERARRFYGSVFGWQFDEYPELNYSMVTSGPTGDRGPTEPGFINGGMAQRGGDFRAPTLVIAVPDIDEALAAVEAAGGAIVSGRDPVGDMGFSAYFTDPEGNLLGLWESATAG
ncbi:MAG: VOC family protein [Actinomycetes bacterium]|jgi:predicted enzyme related to lactoylglutathione lyase